MLCPACLSWPEPLAPAALGLFISHLHHSDSLYALSHHTTFSSLLRDIFPAVSFSASVLRYYTRFWYLRPAFGVFASYLTLPLPTSSVRVQIAPQLIIVAHVHYSHRLDPRPVYSGNQLPAALYTTQIRPFFNRAALDRVALSRSSFGNTAASHGTLSIHYPLHDCTLLDASDPASSSLFIQSLVTSLSLRTR